MPSVHLKSVSFSYTSSIDVIVDVSLDLGPGWVGLVGANGSGKSTLLQLIAGELAPRAGSIQLDSSRTPVICPQDVGEGDESVTKLAFATDSVSRHIIGEFRLEPEDLDRWPTLSPGERKRWQLGAAMAAEPDIILLDEPTNHIDIEARVLLVEALRRYRGLGLAISHDRGFLNDLTTKTIRLNQGHADLRNGNYETAREAWESEERNRQETYEVMKSEQRKLKRRIESQRRTLEMKTAGQKRRLRRADVKDHDARSLEVKGRHQTGAASAANRLRTSQAASERTQAQLAEFEMRRKIGRSFFFAYEPPRRNVLLSYDGPLQAGSTLISPGVTADIRRDDRVWLRGPNGVGKTTLLTALVSGSTMPPDRLLYLPQELDEQQRVAALEELEQMPSAERGRILSLVAALGVEPDRLLRSRRPSPGEARKLRMAAGMGKGAWCLVLDEPTNHLDLPSIERLEEAVAGYPGAIILATHDEEFATNTTTSTWHLE